MKEVVPDAIKAKEVGHCWPHVFACMLKKNALLEAGRDRIRGESVLYCNTCPCLTCSIKIVQSGIREVVYAQSYSMDLQSHKVMSEANIILRQFHPPKDGIFI